MSEFPIDPWLPAITAAVGDHPFVLVKADPGAGKTTRLPPALLEKFKSVLVVQPRRLAAKLTASWIAENRKVKLGGEVGYQIRLENCTTDTTRLAFVTEGVLARKMMTDPELSAWDVVVLDEFHERHIQTDLALAFLRALKERRPELRVVIMSATLDTSALEAWLPNCARFDIPGRTYPVAVEYRPLTARATLESQVAGSVHELLRDERTGNGNILVFLPGKWEIERATKALHSLSASVDLIPLSADLASNYKLIERDNGRRKVVLSTNVAETSLTLPRITGVVDSGLARISGQAAGSGLPTLTIQRVSQASCIQRTGRAGRTMPGVCHRLFTPFEFSSRPEFTEPEIRRIDLCQALLEIARIYKAEAQPWERLPWFEPPEPKLLQQNARLLHQLGAIDQKGQLTDLGRRMASLPLHPRLGRMVFWGESASETGSLLLAALIVNEGMLLKNDWEARASGRCDVTYQATLMLEGDSGRGVELDRGKTARVREGYRSLQSYLKLPPLDQLEGVKETLIRRAIFNGFADRAARFRPLADTGARGLKPYNFCLGRGGTLSPGSVLHDEAWIVAVEARESPGEDPSGLKGKIYAASALEPEWILEDPFQLLSHRRETIVESKSGKVRTFERRYYGNILFDEKRVEESAEAAMTLYEKVRSRWPDSYGPTDALDAYHGKIALLDKHNIPHNLPHFKGELLDLLIDALVHEAKSVSEVRDRSLGDAIQEQLSYEDLELLRLECPDEVKLAGGRRLKVHYGEGDPWIESRIQDFFGQKDTPAICRARQPLVCRLLAPNQRPAQITSDLRRFWEGSYHDVKKELKRRYPKHPWPDDPANSMPPAPRKK